MCKVGLYREFCTKCIEVTFCHHWENDDQTVLFLEHELCTVKCKPVSICFSCGQCLAGGKLVKRMEQVIL